MINMRLILRCRDCDTDFVECVSTETECDERTGEISKVVYLAPCKCATERKDRLSDLKNKLLIIIEGCNND